MYKYLNINYYYIENYYKANFPTDSDHIPCGYSKNEQYPMVYFPDISNPTQVHLKY